MLYSTRHPYSTGAPQSRRLLFLPNNVPAGIESVDPMIDVRSAAYSISFGERQ